MDNWLTPLKADVIMVIDGVRNISRLSREIDVTHGAFTHSFKSLKEKGYVVGELSGREIIPTLTKEGEKLAKICLELKYILSKKK